MNFEGLRKWLGMEGIEVADVVVDDDITRYSIPGAAAGGWPSLSIRFWGCGACESKSD